MQSGIGAFPPAYGAEPRMLRVSSCGAGAARSSATLGHSQSLWNSVPPRAWQRWQTFATS
eukprot:2004831-Pyramimonas_sp.AAC.1